MANELVFDAYSEYYDLIYSDKKYADEVAAIHQRFALISKGGHSILEFGAGTGGHARLFADMGFDVCAIEKSAEMLEKATPVRGVEFLCGDMLDVDMGRKFDYVMAMFHVLSYVTTSDDLLRFFENASRHLNKGGGLIFDCWFTPGVCSQRPTSREKNVESDEIAVRRIASASEDLYSNTVSVHYEIQVTKKDTDERFSFREVHKMRHFSIPEIQLAAAQSGLELVEVSDLLTGDDPSHASWAVCFVMRKN